MGKTTLLKHIAARLLPIPKNIDLLLCEQDVQADDTKAVEAVLKADKKRWDLLEEEKRLSKRIDAGKSDQNRDQLVKYRDQLVKFRRKKVNESCFENCFLRHLFFRTSNIIKWVRNYGPM